MVETDPTRADGRSEVLAALARELQGASQEDTTADTIIARAVDLIPDADLVSVTLKARRAQFTTIASTNDVSREADQRQYDLREGPCVEATTGDEWYRSGDVGADPRWPRWGPEAAALGIRSLLSVRLEDRGDPIGALNLYATEPGLFHDTDEVDFAVLYATHAAIALTSERRLSGLTTALQSRHHIGVAQGMLMERFGLDLEQSFNLLRRYSSTLNIRLSEVAEHVMESRSLPGTDSEG